MAPKHRPVSKKQTRGRRKDIDGRRPGVEEAPPRSDPPTGPKPRLGERRNYACPVCGGGNADATYKTCRDGGEDWFIGCWSLKCQTGGRYLVDLGRALGLGDGASKDELALAIRTVRRGSSGRSKPKSLPSRASVERWAARLLVSGEPLQYLTCSRGLSLDVIRKARIGWNGKMLIFPMFWRGELVALKRRAPRSGAQMMSWPGTGRPWPLYPEPDRSQRRILVVAGELDALRARSAGIPAASVTLGAGHWPEPWTEELWGLRVVVCFDNNEEEQARERVTVLKAAGIDARRLDLRRLGLDAPKGDLSDYLDGGGSIKRVQATLRRRIVRRTWRSAHGG